MQQPYKFLNTDKVLAENPRRFSEIRRNIAVTISYDGSAYHGWQVQKNALTIQEVFQNVLFKIIKEKTDIKGCSRTDTGVHANMYVINFKTSCKIECKNLILALNKFLPNDIAAIACKEVADEFHARYSCAYKEYIYKIWHNRIKNPFLNNRALHYWYPINVKELNEASKYFLGTHDFTSFSTLDKREATDMTRTIANFEVYRSPNDENIIEFKVRADGFLYNMVRIMVGTLLRVAQGKFRKEDIPKIIDSKSRKNAGPTAPAEGLYLNKVFY